MPCQCGYPDGMSPLGSMVNIMIYIFIFSFRFTVGSYLEIVDATLANYCANDEDYHDKIITHFGEKNVKFP